MALGQDTVAHRMEDDDADILAFPLPAGSPATNAPAPAAAEERRTVRLTHELDQLEMLPFSNAESAYAQAVSVVRRARALGAKDLELRGQLVEADVLGRRGKHTASGQLILEINAWAIENNHRHLMARSHRLLSMFYDSIGDMPSSWEHAVRAVELLDDSMSERLRADHLFGLGMALLRTGSFDAARDRYRMALELAEGLDDAPLRLKILNNLAWLEDDAGDPRRAMEIARRMRTFAAQHHVALDAACLDTIAHAQVMLGQYAEAEATLRPIIDAEDLSSWESEGLAEALRTAASAQRLQGNFAQAQATLDRCIDLCQERGIEAIRVEALEEQSQIYASQRKFKRAFEQYIAFHQADQALRSAEREANARTLQAVFETDEARRDSERFRQMALRDPLTGLRNRRFVETELPVLLARSQEEGVQLSVAIVDLDHFKLVNDTHSHAIGDEVLCRVSDMLAAATAEAGFAARMGGEEFLLVFPGRGAANALRRFEDVRLAVESYPWDDVTPGLRVTVSIGATSAQPRRMTQATILGQADRNLYTAKNGGRNRVVSDAD